MSTSKKVPVAGGKPLEQNPFHALENLPDNRAESAAVMPSAAAGSLPAKVGRNRGRVDIRRMTAGRGGKTVTVVEGFVGIGLPEKESLAKTMQRTCGCGGTVKDGRIEIQGDKREQVARVLEAAGFRPVMAGG